jgi:hypothetical protein
VLATAGVSLRWEIKRMGVPASQKEAAI